MVTYDTSQLRALAADFRAAAIEVMPIAAEEIAQAGYEIEARAKALAPVDTGALKNSISTTSELLSVEVGPTVEYGGYVELGTSKMAPQPYLGPAFDEAVDDLVDRLADKVVEI